MTMPRNRIRCLLMLCLAALSAPGETLNELKLSVGRSMVLDFPTDVRQISTSDPAVMDAVAVSTREVLVHAKAVGSATVIVWSKTGERSVYTASIDQNLEALKALVKETFPSEEIHVQSTRDSLSLTGRVSAKDVSDRAVLLVTPFAKTIVNNLQIAPPPIERQIMLKVKFAELDRTATRSFGVNLLSTGAGNTIGRLSTGQFSPPRPDEINSGGVNKWSLSEALEIFAFRPDLNLGAFIRALQQEGVLQILAEPNLVTLNGKEASFLVGGEFPVPVLQGSGVAGAVTIQFREFGIRLTFNPVITPNNTIRMFVRPEVSTVDLANSVTVSGFVIPALATRRMETNVELGEGQSFVIAGLVDDRVQASLSKIPGLSSIPLLGHMFRSRDERKSRTELVVMVTPELTRPLQPGEPAPTPVMPYEFLPNSSDAKKSKDETSSTKTSTGGNS